MEEGYTVVMGRETARSDGRHGVVKTVKPSHAQHLVGCGTRQRKTEEYHPYTLGRRRETRMQLCLYRTRSLSREHLSRTAHH